MHALYDYNNIIFGGTMENDTQAQLHNYVYIVQLQVKCIHVVPI